MKNLSDYYISIKNLSLDKQNWSEAEEQVFRSAILGKSKIEFELRKPYDDSLYQTQLLVNQTIKNLNIDTEKFKVDVKVESRFNLNLLNDKIVNKLKQLGMQNVKSKLIGSYSKILASFPDVCLLDLNNEFHKIYFESVTRILKRRKNLSHIEQKCCFFLDNFYVDAKLAINKNQRFAQIRNPAENVYDESYDPLAYEIIASELKKVDFLRFIKQIESNSFYNEEFILVWNFDKKNTRLLKSEVPDFISFGWETEFLQVPEDFH